MAREAPEDVREEVDPVDPVDRYAKLWRVSTRTARVTLKMNVDIGKGPKNTITIEIPIEAGSLNTAEFDAIIKRFAELQNYLDLTNRMEI